MRDWRGRLIEDMTCRFRNFKVHSNDFQFKKCTHPYKMLFTAATTMEDIPLPEIQHPKYQFKDFEQILNKDYDTLALFG